MDAKQILDALKAVLDANRIEHGHIFEVDTELGRIGRRNIRALVKWTAPERPNTPLWLVKRGEFHEWRVCGVKYLNEKYELLTAS
jgi:hypothetical protein